MLAAPDLDKKMRMKVDVSDYCYKTRVWTDFGRVRVRTDIGQ